MNYSVIHDKQIALLISNTEKEDDVHIYIGKVVREGTQLIFVNSSQNWRVSLSKAQFGRIMKVTEEVKEIFFPAEYFLPMSITSLPENSNEDFDSTGLKWH
jgi:hypothetical protein